METTRVYWDFIGMMENEIETTVMGLYRLRVLGFRV